MRAGVDYGRTRKRALRQGQGAGRLRWRRQAGLGQDLRTLTRPRAAR